MTASDLTDSMIELPKKRLNEMQLIMILEGKTQKVSLIFLTGYIDMRNNAENKSLTVV